MPLIHLGIASNMNDNAKFEIEQQDNINFKSATSNVVRSSYHKHLNKLISFTPLFYVKNLYSKVTPVFFNKLKIEHEVSKLVKNDLLVDVGILMNNGYTLTHQQNKKITSRIISCYDDDLFKNFKKAKEAGFIFSKEMLTELFFLATYQIYCKDYLTQYFSKKHMSLKNIFSSDEVENMDYHEYCFLTMPMIHFLKNSDNEQYLFNSWVNRVKQYNKTGRYKNEYISVKHTICAPYKLFEFSILKTLTLKQKIKLGALLQKTFKKLDKDNHTESETIATFIEKLNLPGKKIIPHTMENLIAQTRNVYLNKKVKKIPSTYSAKSSIVINNNHLPDSASVILKNIAELYEKLHLDYPLLSEDIQMNIERFILTRIPEITNKYLSLDIKYRNTMKNSEGKTATEILNSSLSNIQTYLMNNYVTVHEIKFSSLNVSYNHTKEYLK